MNITGYISRKGIQGKLITLFLLLGLIPMIVMGSVFYYKSTTALVKNANAEITNLSAKAIELLDFQLAIYRLQMDNLVLPCGQVLDMMQFGMDITGGNRDVTMKHFREQMKIYPAYKRIRIIDEKGNEAITTSGESADKKNNVSAYPWFKRAFTAREVIFSDVHIPREISEPVIIMTKTMYSQEGKPFAVIAADISSEAAMTRITNIKIGREGFAYIVNGEGRVIAHPDKTKVLQLDLGASDFGKEILQKKTGTIEYLWDGRQYLASFQEYPALAWIIISAANKDDILESANVMKILFIILVSAMAIFSLVTGVIFTFRLVRPISRIVTGLSDGSDQVASASAQVSASSQLLAGGASVQASSLEETSSSLEEMSSMTKQTADNANHAKVMMNEAKAVVEKANVQMAQLTEAIGQITRSSEETGKIIKTIDEIAFQTNLLALNAAVEAARAGESGAGFAVVADEVRNLALRSAEAARNTSDLIEKTIKAVRNGNEMTVSTQEAFRANAELSGKISQLVDEIASASEEQAHGIAQVNTAVAEMDKVTQQTAATAEESASAAEEMNAQAQQMRGYVEELAAMVGVSMERSGPSGMVPVSPAEVRKPALPAPLEDKKKRRIRSGQANHTRPRPDDIILCDRAEKDGFKDF